ncbi:unnamed protein product [Adineta ricciae]|uniref:ubiquitinyl hydrolase 1 n=1 Tax=Adineta ricciae TaxID=249248 RepID=A0A814JU89_ADIRI|nr:unnamed protein product [Adineta ricciae]CAF1618012.1 unnamed protein product [Adineta ricciae]
MINSSPVAREYSLRISKNVHHWPDLLQRVYEEQVALEDMFTRGTTVYGTVRVNNIAFDKRVSVRFTIDRWRTYSIINALHSIHHADTNTDCLQFKLHIPKEELQSPPTRLSFAICYRINQREFWDNNFGENYNLDVIERNTLDASSKSFKQDQWLYRQLAQDYHAISDGRRDLCGLKNLGGTCYMNSVLQSLSVTASLTDSLLIDHRIDMNDGTVLREYVNLLYLLRYSDCRVLSPNPFKQIFGHLHKAYLQNQQQDAHEFLLLLLDCLHQDLIQIKSKKEDRNTSLILDLFYGTYRTTTTCSICKNMSINYDPFLCLSLPIPSMHHCTLEDCFVDFDTDESLTDDQQWFCPTCQCLCDATRRLEIEKLPKVLIIQLKRFELNFDQQWVKNNSHVYYPLDSFDLKQYCSSSSSYALYSAINHNGTLNDGHYTTFCRNLSNDSSAWFECDDDKVEYSSTDKLLMNTNAYLLFYILERSKINE